MKMPMMPWMRSIANELAHLFFPRHCLLCGRSLARGEEQICLPCLCQLPRTEQHLQADNPLVEALREAFPFERGMAFYYFEINPLCAEAMVEMLHDKQFKAIEIMCDFYGKSRFIRARI